MRRFGARRKGSSVCARQAPPRGGAGALSPGGHGRPGPAPRIGESGKGAKPPKAAEPHLPDPHPRRRTQRKLCRTSGHMSSTHGSAFVLLSSPCGMEESAGSEQENEPQRIAQWDATLSCIPPGGLWSPYGWRAPWSI